jgi:hypothetical protein
MNLAQAARMDHFIRAACVYPRFLSQPLQIMIDNHYASAVDRRLVLLFDFRCYFFGFFFRSLLY